MRLVKHRHLYIYTIIYIFIKKIQDIFLNTMGVQNSNKILKREKIKSDITF